MQESLEQVTSLFLEQTLRHWHFSALVKALKLSRERVNTALKTLQKKRMITRIKPRNRMPYYIANRDSPDFRLEKRLYGFQLLQESGLFSGLLCATGIKTAILFGSFARGDWNPSSDVDLFIFGDPSLFEKGRIEQFLKREIQIFAYDNPKRMKRELEHSLISNIVKGYNIKGTMEPFEVAIND